MARQIITKFQNYEHKKKKILQTFREKKFTNKELRMFLKGIKLLNNNTERK